MWKNARVYVESDQVYIHDHMARHCKNLFASVMDSSEAVLHKLTYR
jgi:hypothetical protein